MLSHLEKRKGADTPRMSSTFFLLLEILHHTRICHGTPPSLLSFTPKDAGVFFPVERKKRKKEKEEERRLKKDGKTEEKGVMLF